MADCTPHGRPRDCRGRWLPVHGMKSESLYKVWGGMIQRCCNKNSSGYRNYGGRGIWICREWQDSFVSFREWAVRSGYRERLTIDRIDCNGGYCPENCRWATRSEQSNNKRTTRYIVAFGESKTATDWAKDSRCVVDYEQLRLRIKRKWNAETALTKPYRIPHSLSAFGETKTYAEWVKDDRCRVGFITLSVRILRGWEPEDAISSEKLHA